MTNRMIKHYSPLAAIQFLYINLINLIIRFQGINMVLTCSTSLKINMSAIYNGISEISKNKYKIWVQRKAVLPKVSRLPFYLAVQGTLMLLLNNGTF